MGTQESLQRESGMSDVRMTCCQDTIRKWILDKDAAILVVGGGEIDRAVFHSLGFTNVVISNLDSRLKGDEFAPYKWSYQKAEELSLENDSFDCVVVHAALHHCESPHRALLEMYRVARKGAIAFELCAIALLMKALEQMGLSPSYEHLAVYYNEGKFGGVNNTEIPNYIYRWTEREIEKTINSYAPYAKRDFLYEYGSDEPFSASVEKKATLKKLVIGTAKPVYRLFTKAFPQQQNLFAFYVQKPDLEKDVYPWIELLNGEPGFNIAVPELMRYG
jgi:ubiquinone/menaquinone biosynthesis C-methylase UbiE